MYESKLIGKSAIAESALWILEKGNGPESTAKAKEIIKKLPIGDETQYSNDLLMRTKCAIANVLNRVRCYIRINQTFLTSYAHEYVPNCGFDYYDSQREALSAIEKGDAIFPPKSIILFSPYFSIDEMQAMLEGNPDTSLVALGADLLEEFLRTHNLLQVTQHMDGQWVVSIAPFSQSDMAAYAVFVEENGIPLPEWLDEFKELVSQIASKEAPYITSRDETQTNTDKQLSIDLSFASNKSSYKPIYESDGRIRFEITLPDLTRILYAEIADLGTTGSMVLNEDTNSHSILHLPVLTEKEYSCCLEDCTFQVNLYMRKPADDYVAVTFQYFTMLLGHHDKVVRASYTDIVPNQGQINIAETLEKHFYCLCNIINMIQIDGNTLRDHGISNALLFKELGMGANWSDIYDQFSVAQCPPYTCAHFQELLDAQQQYVDRGIDLQINAEGMENVFIPLSDIADQIEQEDLVDDVIGYDRVYPMIELTEIADHALKMASLFRVTKAAFDTGHDRECEILDGFIQRAWMVNALRSFAWTLVDYAKRNSKTIEEIDLQSLKKIISFCCDRNWKNYYCDTDELKALCTTPDLHVYYVPYEYCHSFDVACDLEWLRYDLLLIYPAIKTLWDSLAANRDHNKPLTGIEADIVYAWCSFAYAARSPFYHEDGPMHCHFSQVSDE